MLPIAAYSCRRVPTSAGIGSSIRFVTEWNRGKADKRNQLDERSLKFQSIGTRAKSAVKMRAKILKENERSPATYGSSANVRNQGAYTRRGAGRSELSA